MRKSTLKSTTSLVVSLSLIASPVLAQQADTQSAEPELCAGLLPEGETDLATLEVAADPVLPCLGADGAVIADQEALETALTDQAAALAAMDETAEQMPDELIVEEAAPEDTAEATVVEEPATEGDVAATAEANETEVVVESDADVAEQADTEATATEDSTENAEGSDAVTVEGGGDDVTVTEGLPGGGDTDVVVTEGMPEGGETEAEVAEGLPEDENSDVEVTDGLADGGTLEVTEDTPTAEEPLIVIDENPAAAAAAEEDADGATAEVVVEELTEEDVRASSEDFETTATGDVAAESTRSDDDDGLSNFERALLIGLGAVVVGSVLDNGDEVVSNSGDRVVVRRNDELVVLKDDDVLLRQPGSQVETQSFSDGSTRTVVTRADDSRIITIRASDGRVLRRTRILDDGTEFVLFDDTVQSDPIEVTELPSEESAAAQMQVSRSDVDSIRMALLTTQNTALDRTYSLRQIRQIEQVRALAPEVELDTVTFASGSAAIQPSQAEELTDLGLAISNIIDEDPSQVFLIEGHTDAVGDAGYNLALSDRRAETVALAMTEYFGIPPENLITQGYGESILKIQTLGDERANRRASVRNITSLLR